MPWPFSRMRSKGSSFTGLGIDGVFTSRCATVCSRPQVSVVGGYGRSYGGSCQIKRSCLEVSDVSIISFLVMSCGRRGTS